MGTHNTDITVSNLRAYRESADERSDAYENCYQRCTNMIRVLGKDDAERFGLSEVSQRFYAESQRTLEDFKTSEAWLNYLTSIIAREARSYMDSVLFSPGAYVDPTAEMRRLADFVGDAMDLDLRFYLDPAEESTVQSVFEAIGHADERAMIARALSDYFSVAA